MNSSLPSLLVSSLDELSELQLRQLNHLVVEKLRLISKARHLKNLSKFNVLDRVYFDHHEERMTGTIIRLNQKTASIKTDDGGHWNVPPDFLHAFQDYDATETGKEPFVVKKGVSKEKYPGVARNQPCPCGTGRKYKKCCLIIS